MREKEWYIQVYTQAESDEERESVCNGRIPQSLERGSSTENDPQFG